MDMFGSQCSSGCESGWTVYLEQSFLPPNGTQMGTQFVDAKAGFSNKGESIAQEENHGVEVEEDEEEDMSMVSDASSGPPQLQEAECYINYEKGCLYPPFKSSSLSSGGKKVKVTKEHRNGKNQELPSFLDDTASSPALNFPKDNFGLANKQFSMESNLEYSQGFSATYFEGRSAYQENFGYIHPPFTGNQFQNNQWF